MAHDKKQRHDMDHEAASTDVADLSHDGGATADTGQAAQAASKHQRNQLTEGDGGRYSGPVGVDVEARILAVQVEGGGTRIMIGKGRNQGVEMDMPGYIKRGDGMLADFRIEGVKGDTSWAMTDVTPDAIGDHVQVVVNPGSMPKSSEPQKDMKARIVGVSIEDGQTKIMIGRGRRSGAAAGMKGYIVGAGGKPFMSFVISQEHSGFTAAYVSTTIDGLAGHDQVILNPSSEPGEAGKQAAPAAQHAQGHAPA